jgi:Tol biopolymer transport system component
MPTQSPISTPQPEASPTNPPAVVLSGKIAYSVGRTLYVVDVKTKDTLFTVSNMRQPDLRADGAQILADGLADPASVWNIDAKTGAFIREQIAYTDDYHPFWSPDGSRFTYDSKHHGGGYTMLYTQGLTNRKPLEDIKLHSDGQQIQGHSPVWTHDDLIAFTGCDYWPGGTGGSRCGIYVMPSWSGRPTLSHSGSTDMRATDNYGGLLVFMSRETGNWEVFVMPSRGGEARNLSQSPGSQDGLGTFSPDGKKVAFVSNRGGGWAIWVVNLNGNGMNKLLDLPGEPTGPPWYDDSISWGP